MTTIIAVAVILIVVVLGIFLFYNFYLKPRFYAQHTAERKGSSPAETASQSSNVTRRSKKKGGSGEIQGRASNVGLTSGASSAKKAGVEPHATMDNEASQQNIPGQESMQMQDFQVSNKNFKDDQF